MKRRNLAVLVVLVPLSAAAAPASKPADKPQLQEKKLSPACSKAPKSLDCMFEQMKDQGPVCGGGTNCYAVDVCTLHPDLPFCEKHGAHKPGDIPS